MGKVVHKGKQGSFSHVATVLCGFYGNNNRKFEYTDRNGLVTCKRCLKKLKEKSK